MKRVKKSAPDARVEQAADVLEQIVCSGPRHIVEIAHYNERRGLFLVFLADDQNLGVTMRGVGVLGRKRRPRMKAAKLNLLP